MKKLISLLLVVIFALTLSSCSLSIKDLINKDTDTGIVPGENEFPIIPATSEKTTSLQLNYAYDHSSLADTGERIASLLVNGSYLMDGLSSVTVPKDAVAGDILVIKHTGELVTNTSYPGMTSLKNGTVKSFSVTYAEVICLNGDEINAEQIKSEYSLSTENVIIDKVGRFVTLDDYDGEELYLVVDQQKLCNCEDEPKPIACMLAYNPRAVSK